MRDVAGIVETVVRYECPKCGNNCRCGVPYIPKTARAAEAVKANPEKSNRAIAKELGIHHSTVAEARQTTGGYPPVERTGLDGKTRKMPSTPPPEHDPDAVIIKQITILFKRLSRDGRGKVLDLMDMMHTERLERASDDDDDNTIEF